MKKIILLLLISIFILSCNNKKQKKVRNFVDTIGFAHKGYQVDSVLARINRNFGDIIADKQRQLGITPSTTWKVVISPHDDHAYVSYIYPLLLKNIKAKTLIIFGVAHKAWKLHLSDSLIFGSFDQWKGAFGNIKVSELRDEIISELPENSYKIDDSMMSIEHSIEAFLPFLQKFNRNIEIIPILIPYMSYNRMLKIAPKLAASIADVTKRHNLKWGKDFAIIISTDAVHYGDQDWGGSNFAFYGTDSAGYKKTIEHEHKIISTIVGNISPKKILQFTKYTVQDTNYKTYKWTWCGRYSVPLGLLTSYFLEKDLKENIKGSLVEYATSISHKKLKVEDLGMGITAPANIHHWVGYVAIGYK